MNERFELNENIKLNKESELNEYSQLNESSKLNKIKIESKIHMCEIQIRIWKCNNNLHLLFLNKTCKAWCSSSWGNYRKYFLMYVDFLCYSKFSVQIFYTSICPWIFDRNFEITFEIIVIYFVNVEFLTFKLIVANDKDWKSDANSIFKKIWKMIMIAIKTIIITACSMQAHVLFLLRIN